jgi:Flp pilus assembly CpaE family ATPase
LKAAKELVLVCTPELGALHQARRKSEMLQSLGHGPRTTVILNRTHGRSAMSIVDIEEILQLPVRFTVPNGEREVTQATVQAVALEGRSAVARQIEAVARHMMPATDAVSFKVKARRFLETFSVTPAREKAGWWR